MESRIIYTTFDGKEFTDKYQAKKHECELTNHVWQYYNADMGMQKECNDDSKVAFCKKCNKQEILK